MRRGGEGGVMNWAEVRFQSDRGSAPGFGAGLEPPGPSQ